MLAFAGGGSLLESQETILSTFHPNVRAFLLCNRGGDANTTSRPCTATVVKGAIHEKAYIMSQMTRRHLHEGRDP
jgi:hypothetical protein